MVERRDGLDGASGDGPDDARRYPMAPLPAHERRWRHPSEVGQAQWAMSEPPVAIGKGLLVTTGAIGCALGVAVLWLLVPGGLDPGPVAAPTVTRSVGAVNGSQFGTAPRTDLLTPTTIAVEPTIALPTESVPPATVSVRSTVVGPRATAVLLEGTGMLLTTAAAVRDQRRVSLEDASDTRHEAEVIVVAGDVAMLVTHGGDTTSVDVLGFDEVASPDAGDAIVIMASTPVDADYPGADAALDLGDTVVATDIAEGTPVVDAEGALVGLCTHRPSSTSGDPATVHVVPIAAVLEALLDDEDPDEDDGAATATPSSTAPDDTEGSGDSSAPTAWIGVRLVDGDNGRGLVVESVLETSPAEAAGIVVGDLIVDIAGIPVGSVTEVRGALDGLRPGDTVTIGVSSSGGPRRGLSVVLGAAAPDV